MNRALSLYLDVVRFVAALLVLLHHAADPRFGNGLPHFLTSTGTDPVIVFFVLSGFVIAYTAESKDATAVDYAFSRLSRLYSVVVPAIVLTIVLDDLGRQIFPALYDGLRSHSVAMIKNAEYHTFTHSLLTGVFLNEIWWLDVWPGTNAPFWSMGYEAPYYLLFGILFYARGWTRIVSAAAACLLIGPRILLLAPVWFLGVGTWHYYKRARIGISVGALLQIFSLLLYVTFVASGVRNTLNDQYPSRTLSDYIIGVLFAASLIGFKGIVSLLEPLLSRFSKSIRSAAGCTFSLYLYHYPLIIFLSAVSNLAFGGVYQNDRFPVIGAFVVIISVLSCYCLSLITEQKKGSLKSAMRSLLAPIRNAYGSRSRRPVPVAERTER